MNRHIQIHILTPYGPSNLNRDDLGRPKTAIVGGKMRLRISSQSLKRAWRTSDLFKESFQGSIGIRTRSFGREVLEKMLADGVDRKTAVSWTREIVGMFGKPVGRGSDHPVDIEQLVHLSPAEMKNVDELVQQVITMRRAPDPEQGRLLSPAADAVDIALFGRMLAKGPRFNVEASAQVAHAFTVHEATMEDDFFTAVDDLNKGRFERASGHMSATQYGSGIYYSYLCINRDQLMNNLAGERDLSDQAIGALIRTAAQVGPTGKQNSFASMSYAHYLMVEQGDHQPRSLVGAFLTPIKGPEVLSQAIAALEQTKKRIDEVYKTEPVVEVTMNAWEGKGSLDEVCTKVRT